MKVLLFGATGSAGASVLKVCLASPGVEEVRVISRRAPAATHPKLRVYLHHDFLDYRLIREAFVDLDACFFCLGISVQAVPHEADYRRITHDFAAHAAAMLAEHSPNATFHYLSARGANTRSPMMWCRVKGETDEELMQDRDAVCWRPMLIDGEHSDHHPVFYQVFRPYFKLFRAFEGLYVSGEDLGRAMIHATELGLRHRIVSNREIRALADAKSPVAGFDLVRRSFKAGQL